MFHPTDGMSAPTDGPISRRAACRRRLRRHGSGGPARHSAHRDGRSARDDRTTPAVERGERLGQHASSASSSSLRWPSPSRAQSSSSSTASGWSLRSSVGRGGRAGPPVRCCDSTARRSAADSTLVGRRGAPARPSPCRGGPVPRGGRTTRHRLRAATVAGARGVRRGTASVGSGVSVMASCHPPDTGGRTATSSCGPTGCRAARCRRSPRCGMCQDVAESLAVAAFGGGEHFGHRVPSSTSVPVPAASRAEANRRMVAMARILRGLQCS